MASAGRAESLSADWEAAPVGLVVTDADGLIIRANAVFAGWTGRPAEALLGQPFHRTLTSGGRLFHETRAVPTLRLAGEVDFAVSLRSPDGTERPVLVRAVRDDAAPAPGHPKPIVRLAVFDATSRADFERQLVSARAVAEASAAHLRAAADAARDFLSAGSDEEVARALVEAIRTATTAKAVVMLRPDADGQPQLLAGTDLIGSEEPLDDAGLRDEERPDVVALRTGQRVVIPTPDAAHRFAPALAAAMRATRLRALSAEPLLDDDGAVWAVVVVFFGRAMEAELPDGQLAAALGRQARAAQVRISLERRLERSARVDGLTGLVNRGGLEGPLDEAVDAAVAAAGVGEGQTAAREAGMAVLFVDLDGFKAVNDSLGHRGGDAVLQETARRLGASVRVGDLVARFGGDEFVIVAQRIDEREAVGIAQRLLSAIREPLVSLPDASLADPRVITASVGIALIDAGAAARDGLTADAVVRAADSAMYESKRGGGNAVTVVRPGADAAIPLTRAETPT